MGDDELEIETAIQEAEAAVTETPRGRGAAEALALIALARVGQAVLRQLDAIGDGISALEKSIDRVGDMVEGR